MLTEPEPETLELMVPPWTSRPLATELVTPEEVEIPLVAINLPPEIETEFWEIAPEVVVPEEIVVDPESEIPAKELVPDRDRDPELAT